MWALPDIHRLNEQAVKDHQRTKDLTQEDLCRDATCDFCTDPAAEAHPYYDVFGDPDVPKGHVFLCSQHAEDFGSSPEGYFWCDGCERLQVENYTWERYQTEVDGDSLCLRCAFFRFIEDDDNWLRPSFLKGKTSEKILEWAKRNSKHLIAVESNYWEERLEFVGNAEFDSYTGGQISGDALYSLVKSGFEKCKDRKKQERVLLILDAAYQFAVSLGVYIWKEEGDAKSGEHPKAASA